MLFSTFIIYNTNLIGRYGGSEELAKEVWVQKKNSGVIENAFFLARKLGDLGLKGSYFEVPEVSHVKFFFPWYMFQEMEKELQLQVSMRAEMEMAMKLLEKDIHEKQDTVVSLRRQLEDIKAINLEMYKKLQVGDWFLILYFFARYNRFHQVDY